MFSQLCLLVKRQAYESLSFLKKDKRQFDFLGAIIYIVLFGALLYLLAWSITKFGPVYATIKSYGTTDTKERLYELISIAYAAILLAFTISGVKTICFELFHSKELLVFASLPIKISAIFLSKVLWVYLKQLATTVLIILPVNFTLAAVTSTNSFYFGLMSIICCLLIPLASISIASLLALPWSYFKRFLTSHNITLLALVTVVLGLGFFLYAGLLDFFKNLLIGGNIKTFFNEQNMYAIANTVKLLFPANMLAGLCMRRNAGLCVLFFFLFIAIMFVIDYFVIKNMYESSIKNRLSFQGKTNFSKPKKIKAHSVLSGLFCKEFSDVLRTPSYSFQYFSTALIMPLMVYFCMYIGESMLSSTLGITGCNFELAVFIVLVFSVLTNSFCSTNISRDGTAFYVYKTLPFNYRFAVLAKVLFCLVVSGIAALISIIVCTAFFNLNAWQAISLTYISLTATIAQINFATRLDFNKPHFSSLPDGEIRESNTTASIVTFCGLAVSVLIGSITLLCGIAESVSPIASGLPNVLEKLLSAAQKTNLSVIAACICITLSTLVCVSSTWFLMHGLEKKYYGEDND